MRYTTYVIVNQKHKRVADPATSFEHFMFNSFPRDKMNGRYFADNIWLKFNLRLFLSSHYNNPALV